MAGRQAATQYVVPNDGNEEICGGCGKGGELLCCDACPAAFHALCTGYSCVEEVPDSEEWLCWACALASGKPFLHSQTPLVCQEGDQLMVASTSSNASVFRGKKANPGELFWRAAVTAVTGNTVHLRFLPPKQGTEELPNDSERLWHGTADTTVCWVQTPGGAYSPNARAFVIDTKRVQALQQSGGGLVEQIAAAGINHQHAATLLRTATPDDALPQPAEAAASAADGMQPKAERTDQRPSLKARRQQSAARAAQQRLKLPHRAHATAGQPLPTSEDVGPSAAAAAESTLLPSHGGAADPSLGRVAHDPAAAEAPPNGHAAPAAPASPEEAAFMEALQRFHTSNGRPLRLPVRLHKQREADLYRMWRQTMAYGGFEPVSAASIWSTIGRGQDPPPGMQSIASATKGIYTRVLKAFEQATREGLTGLDVPEVVEVPVPVPRGRPPLRAARRKSAPAKAAKPAAKPEPWMLPPPHAWTHIYEPLADVSALPAAKRRKVEAAAASRHQPEPAAADRLSGPGATAASGAGDAAPAAPSHPRSSASGGLTAAEEAALLDAGRRRGFAWEQTISPQGQPEAVVPPAADVPPAAEQPAAAAPLRAPKPAKHAGLAAEELAGPVARSAAANSLAAGDAVEVRPLTIGMRGAWLPATVLQVEQGSVAEGGRTFLVEYRDWVPSRDPAAEPLLNAVAAFGSPPMQSASTAAADLADNAAAAPGVPATRDVHADGKVREWVPLLSRATTSPYPVVRVRVPLASAPTKKAETMEPGSAVEAWCGGAWVMGRMAGSPGAPTVEAEAPPDGEGGTLEVSEAAAVRMAFPEAASGFGMLAPLEPGHMLPRERYRRWLRPRTYRSHGFTFESYACAEELPSHRYIPSLAAGSILPAPSDAPSPTTSAATSAGGAADSGAASGGRGRRRGSSATSPLQPPAGRSRLAKASAPAGAAASPAISDSSPSGSPAAEGADAAPLEPQLRGTAALPLSAATVGADAIEDMDVDIGSGVPASADLQRETLPVNPSAVPVSPGQGAEEAALPKWQGFGSKARHQAAHDAFIKSLPPPDDGGSGSGKPGRGVLQKRSSCGAQLAAVAEASAAPPAQPSHMPVLPNSSAGSPRLDTCDKEDDKAPPAATVAPGAEASDLPAAAPGRVLDAAPAPPPAAAAEHCDTAAPATAADNDDGSDVFIGGTPDASDADSDDSDDPEVDLDALSEPTDSENGESDADDVSDDSDWAQPQRKRKPARGGGQAAKRQQSMPLPPPMQWVAPALPPQPQPVTAGKLALY